MSWQGLLDAEVLPREPTPFPTSYDNHSLALNVSGGARDEAIPPEDTAEEHRQPSIVEPWKCWGGLAGRAANAATKAGHPVITSACWYLDYNSEFDDYFNSRAIAVAESNNAWHGKESRTTKNLRSLTEEVATSDAVPRSGEVIRRVLTEAELKMILGAEMPMWTEKVDFTNLDCRVWPRAAAMALQMWGGNDMHKTAGNLNKNKFTVGRKLMLSYALFREYLWGKGIKAADIYVHEKRPGRWQQISYTPLLKSNIELLRLIGTTNITMSPYGGIELPLKLTSQCKGFTPEIYRPLEGGGLKVSQLNTADGAPGGRRNLLLKWLKEQAGAGVHVVGFCEANGWHELESTYKAENNFPAVRSMAASVGYAYSHILHSVEHPYNIAVMAAHPFVVMGEYGPPIFERGLLHIFLDELDLHVFVAHLNAHSSIDREKETQFIASLVAPLLSASPKQRVIVMGDLNSFYRGDKPLHDQEGLLQMFQRTDNPVFPRLKKKLCTPNGTAINYTPLDNLVDAGLVELCTHFCHMNADGQSPDASECLRSRCAATEPTHYNPEVSAWRII